MTKLRVSQLDPGDAEEAQVVTLVDGKWQAADPGGGPGGTGYDWLEDSGFDLSGMPAGDPGGTLITTLVNEPVSEYAITVIINGLIAEGGGEDYSYWEDPVGTYNIEIYGLRLDDRLRIRYVTAL